MQDISKTDLGQARVSLLMIALSIEQLPQAIKEAVENYLDCHPRSPAAKLRPQMGLEGDIWLAFIGTDLRPGASGVGRSPLDALDDFNLHFMEPVISRNGSTAH